MGCFSGKPSKPKHRNATSDHINNNKACAQIERRNDDQIQNHRSDPSHNVKNDDVADNMESDIMNSSAHKFTLQEVAAATDNFNPESYLGRGGFGKVYKGYLVRVNQAVAIKQLDRDGMQGAREFVAEVVTLSSADHPNLVKLIGFCVAQDQRLLIYEYMPLGSLDHHLFDLTPDSPTLDWDTRIRIAAGAAKGLEYLHEKMNPPTIYRDLKCSNILLGEGYHPKLSDFGLARVGPSGDNTHVSTRVMGTYGYCAPEYAMTGQLTFKSDIYSFGVVLLELLTGRKALDTTKPHKEQSLVAWARPLFKDRKNFSMMADPLLQGQYPRRPFFQLLAIAAMCIHELPTSRPAIGEVVMALESLTKPEHDLIALSP
ncbi:unnamed protein product [Rhodiola kirilowii]